MSTADLTHLLAAILSPVVASILTGLGLLWAQARQTAKTEGATSAATDAAMATMRRKIDDLQTTIATERTERQTSEQRIFGKLDEIAREARGLASHHACQQVAAITELRVRIEHHDRCTADLRRDLHELYSRRNDPRTTADLSDGN